MNDHTSRQSTPDRTTRSTDKAQDTAPAEGLPNQPPRSSWPTITTLPRMTLDNREEDLTGSRDFLDALINSMDDPFFVKDDSHRWIMVNDRACDFLGLSRDKVIGRYDHELFHKDRIDHITKTDNVVLVHHKVITEEETIPRQGKNRIVSVKKSPYTDPTSGKTYLTGVMRDITEWKEAESALQKTEGEFRSMVSNIPGIIYQFYARSDGDMGVHYTSDRAMDILGIDTSDLSVVYKTFFACVAPEDKERVLNSIAEAARSVMRWDCEFRFIKPSGEEIHIRGSSQPEVRNDEVIFNGVLLDVTERKHIETALMESEEKLRRSHDNLEMIIDERTAELRSLNRSLEQEIEIRKKTEAALRKREMELQDKQRDLEEMNAALRVLLKQRDEDREDMETNIASNLKTVVIPYVEKLKTSALKDRQKAWVSLIESQLRGITSSFVKGLSSEYLGLSPTEIQVANLIREGKSSKDIGEIMNVSLNTVLTHRYHIRQKTGIKNSKVNLQSYLKTLE